MIPWYKQKTTYTAIAGILTATGAYFEGSIGIPGLISAVFGGLAIIFMRQGIEKSGPSDKNNRELS